MVELDAKRRDPTGVPTVSCPFRCKRGGSEVSRSPGFAGHERLKKCAGQQLMIPLI